ncbi:MAG: hypothetical protein N4A41_02740 [Crocinitomicaceae bacterium]|jgi:hypothetical protein|nr:hypothetical protein [Crocinitomicaceae bacterium]
MKKYFLFIFFPFSIHAQVDLNEFTKGVEMNTWVLNENGYKGDFENQDSVLKVIFIGKFELHPALGAVNLDKRNIKNNDTLIILFRFGPYFTKFEIDSIHTQNQTILDSVSTILISQYEKNGYPFKLSKNQIKDDPVRYAQSNTIINPDLLNRLVRLPDMRFETFSIYIDFNIDMKQTFIHPPSARQMVEDFLIRVFKLNREFLYGLDNVKNY